MNTQQKVQLGLGSLFILAGGAAVFFAPPAAMPLVTMGIAVAGFSNTVTSAIKTIFSKPTNPPTLPEK